MFHLSFLNVASVTLGCYKSRSSVTHGCTWEAGGGASGPRAGDVQATWGLAWARVM
jgi:hypothetical protein